MRDMLVVASVNIEKHTIFVGLSRYLTFEIGKLKRNHKRS